MFLYPAVFFPLNFNIFDPLTPGNQACIRFSRIIIGRKTTLDEGQTDNLPALGCHLDPHLL